MTAPGSYREGGGGLPEASSSAGAVSHGRIANHEAPAATSAPQASPYTPGPWMVTSGGDEFAHYVRVWSGDSLVCECEHHHDRASVEEAEANARLIAAASELLEALQWALTAADRLADITPAGLLRTGIRAKADECRAAIAKAAGGDQ